jgi:hypothetical protein
LSVGDNIGPLMPRFPQQEPGLSCGTYSEAVCLGERIVSRRSIATGVVVATLAAMAPAVAAAHQGPQPSGTGADRARPCPSGYRGLRAGSAKTDITPTTWPVAMAAYSIGRMGDGAAQPFYARSLALQSCADGSTVVLTAIDSQGYFAGYKEDPGAGAAGYGLTAIRLTAAAATGVPAANLMVAATHTHNSPDSLGLWGGSVTDNNKTPYFELVKAQTVAAIQAAVARLRPARLSTGTADIADLVSTLDSARADPQHYPVDHTLRVLQVTGDDGGPIATVADASIHATIAGELTKITPDWPGRLAQDLDSSYPGETSVVFAGAVGRTYGIFPAGSLPPHSDDLTQVAVYGDLLAGRARTAIDAARPVTIGPVETVDTTLQEEIANPAIAALFADEQGTPYVHGVMRSILPPFETGPLVATEVQTVRVGDLMFAGAPGEAYPELGTELSKRVHTTGTVFPISLANDQVGYEPPAFEYPVIALIQSGDNGIFTLNAHVGDDVINQHLTAASQLGFTADGPYDGVTAGPVVPPGTLPPPPAGVSP